MDEDGIVRNICMDQLYSLLYSWSVVESNARSYRLINGHLAMSKSKGAFLWGDPDQFTPKERTLNVSPAGNKHAIVDRSPTNQRLL